MDELADRARAVIEDNLYMVLGTTEPEGAARVSPVYFTQHEFRDFFWVSSPDAHHSRNVQAHPAVTAVIFDSTLPPGQSAAVYLTGMANEVPPADLDEACARAFANLKSTARAFTPAELSGDAPLRLYRLHATTHEVHVRGSDAAYGTGIDSRCSVAIA